MIDFAAVKWAHLLNTIGICGWYALYLNFSCICRRQIGKIIVKSIDVGIMNWSVMKKKNVTVRQIHPKIIHRLVILDQDRVAQTYNLSISLCKGISKKTYFVQIDAWIYILAAFLSKQKTKGNLTWLLLKLQKDQSISWLYFSETRKKVFFFPSASNLHMIAILFFNCKYKGKH